MITVATINTDDEDRRRRGLPVAVGSSGEAEGAAAVDGYGTVIILPQTAQGPDRPAYCSYTSVCVPQ
jgi:hypothetical protein